MPNSTSHSPSRRIVRRSAFCAYCGHAFGPGERGEDEHVIGRRFVPKGTLAGQWNLILTACGTCNDIKSELENDISAITMQPDVIGRYACDDPRFVAEAKRKARTTNRRTRRFVSEPEPPVNITGRFGPMTMKVSFAQPAPCDEARLFQLARLQLAGFFSMLTWQEDQRRGFYWPGAYMPIVAVRKEDWGNPLLAWVEQKARGWDHRLFCIAADGFYKAWIRRRSGVPAVWGWALEWNLNFRLAGFFGEDQALRELAAEAPKLAFEMLHEEPGVFLRYRTETPLAASADQLFELRNYGDSALISCCLLRPPSYVATFGAAFPGAVAVRSPPRST